MHTLKAKLVRRGLRLTVVVWVKGYHLQVSCSTYKNIFSKLENLPSCTQVTYTTTGMGDGLI